MKLKLLLLFAFTFLWNTLTLELKAQAQLNCNQDARITFNGEELPIINCLDDDEAPIFRLRSRPLTMKFAYLVTDQADVILDISTDNFLDLESYGEGDFRVYSFSYEGNVTATVGENAQSTQLADGCFGLSVNFLEVYNIIPRGGTVSTTEGESTIYTCPGDGNPDVVNFSNSIDNRFYAFVVTDDQNRILQTLEANSADFEQAGEGICRVWGVAFVGDLNVNPGAVITEESLASECFSLSNNYVEVIRGQPEGGQISLTNGAKETTVCLSMDPAPLTFQSTGVSNTPFIYVVTNENNLILEILDSNIKDFSGVNPGICKVWGVAYTGKVTAAVGDDITQVALSNDCYDLSDDFITVNRKETIGGNIALEDGTTNSIVCVNDGIPDILSYQAEGEAGESYAFVITNESDEVLAVLDGNSNNFDAAGAGICRVWGIAYSGNLLLTNGDALSEVPFSDECFGLSNNFIEVNRLDAKGGDIRFDDGDLSKAICTGDGNSDLLSFNLENNLGDNTVYLVTDENNIILDITTESAIDFESANAGICRIWGLAYYGNLLAEVGLQADQIELSDQCFDLSNNFLEVIRTQVDGGRVALESGEESIRLCISPDQDGVISMTNTSILSDISYVYLITNETDDFLAVSESNTIDLSGAPSGTCKVYGLSFTGDLTINDLDDIKEVELSSDCYDLSENFVLVRRERVNGGAVALTSGETETLVCVNDGVEDVLMFQTTDNEGTSYAYLVTDENNQLLTVAEGNQQDFNGAGTGICHVWGVAYSGDLVVSTGADITLADLSNDCFHLSDNFITVTRKEVNGGSVSLTTGGTEAIVCIRDGIDDILSYDQTGGIGENYNFVVTDDNNTVLVILDGNSNNFESASFGICHVWGVAYTGNRLFEVGDDLLSTPLSNECYAISENFIQVSRQVVVGGTIAYEDGTESKSICSGDDIADSLAYALSENFGESTRILITDTNNVILAITEDLVTDFEGAESGVCRIWGLSYYGDLLASNGDRADQIELAEGCFALTDNYIEIIRTTIDGGTVSLEDGATEVNLCVGNVDNAELTITTTAGASDGTYTYVVTTDTDIVLFLSNDPVIDFSGAPTGNCKVYGLSYTGNLNISNGDILMDAIISDDCYELSENAILVKRQRVTGGMITTSGGATEQLACVGDGNPDIVPFIVTNGVGAAYTFIITDDNNRVLEITDTTEWDFEGADGGICRVWGVGYSGNLLISAGDDISTSAISDECFDLTSNFLTINRVALTGGTVSLTSGGTETAICVDGVFTTVEVTTTATDEENYIYLITTDSNEFLSLSREGIFDLAGAPLGTCRIYGLSYTGILTIDPLQDILETSLSDACFLLSDNYVTVVRGEVLGGTVSIEGSEETEISICVNDGISDAITVNSDGAVGESFVYVITDENNSIIQISEANQFEFDGVVPGTCRIWGLSYTGSLIAEVGQDASQVNLSNDCFELSENFINIIRREVLAGTVALGDGSEEVNICVGLDNPDVLTVFVVDASLDNDYAYLITDENSNLLAVSNSNEINLNAADAGTCLIYGVAYTGDLIIETGEPVLTTTLTDSCSNISTNFIRVERELVHAGSIRTEAGETEVKVCPGDNRPDVIRFDSIEANTPLFAYLVTDEQNIILGVLDTVDFLDFNSAPEGTCRVWGLAYRGNLTLDLNQDITMSQLTDDCFDLSDNFVTVVRTVPQGGTVSVNNGQTTANVCPGDGNADIIEFSNADVVGDNYVYIITDTSNLVLQVVEGNSFDFDESGAGVCRVWGLSYSGELLIVEGDNVDVSNLSTDCFGLSDNFITINKEAPLAGTFTLDSGADSASICSDENPNVLNFDLVGANGTNYAFVILDISDETVINTIIGVFDTTSFDFNLLPVGIYSVVGVAFEGDLNFNIGDRFDEVFMNLTTECFTVSESAVTVTVSIPDAGNIIAPSERLELCTGDGDANDDVVFFSSNSTSGAELKILLTDDNDELVEVIEQTSIDFGDLPSGNYRVRSISFTGELIITPGENVLTANASTDCADVSENFIAISNTMVDGGTISNPNAENDQIFICEDGNPDVITFDNNSASDASYVYIITDEIGNILIPIMDDGQDFENTGFRVLQVWGVSYTGNLTVNSGENISTTQLSDECFALSNNVITVFSDAPDGGSVTGLNGETEMQLCVGPDNSFLDLANTSRSDLGYAYFLTDTANVVITSSTVNSIDFAGISPGLYRVWGASYSGLLNDITGQSIETSDIASSCFELSGSFLMVNRESDVDGGDLSNLNGDTVIYACPGGGGPDVVVIRTTSQDENYRLLITNESGVVIVPDIGGTVIPFDGAAPGVYEIWGVAFNGTLSVSFGDNIFEDILADSCWVLSNNNLTIVNELPDGGTISTDDGSTSVDVIVGDGLADTLTFQRETTSPNTQYTYLIANEENALLGTIEGDRQNFEDARAGNYRVWGVAYTGDLTVQMGDIITNIALSDDCFDLSENFVAVTVREEGGIPVTNFESTTNDEIFATFAVKLIPNPVIDHLNIQLNSSEIEMASSTVQIYTVGGGLIGTYSMPTNNGVSDFRINVVDFPSGLYVLKLTNGSRSHTLRFAKQ